MTSDLCSFTVLPDGSTRRQIVQQARDDQREDRLLARRQRLVLSSAT
jgi:hypothetical protein